MGYRRSPDRVAAERAWRRFVEHNAGIITAAGLPRWPRPAFALMFDRTNEIAWVGGRRVRLRGMNVVLLDRADGVGGPPVLLPLVRVDSALAIPCEPPRSRDAAEARLDAIRGALFRSPEVREFLKP